MRILYVNPNGSFGGAERALFDLIQAVGRARPDWTLDLIVGGNGDLADAARTLGVDVKVLPFAQSFKRLGDAGAGGPAGNEVSKTAAFAGLSLAAPQLAAYVWKLKALIAERRPDVIHSNGFKAHILTAWAAPRRSRVIWHVHDYAGSRPLMSRLMRAHASRCDVAIANSHSVARDLDSVCRGKLKIVTVHNAVDLERFSPCGPALDLDALCGLAPAPPGCLRVGLVATMARWKGHEVFLRALSMLPRCLPIRGFVVGGPIYDSAGSQFSLEELRACASGLGLDGSVGFTGFLNDAAAAIRALDIVVHASTQPEPFGLAVAEAMACGKPVIASNAGGIGEVISENETALSHRPGDAAGLASAIKRLAADRPLRQRLGAHGRRQAQARFNPARLTRELPPIYEQFASAPQ